MVGMLFVASAIFLVVALSPGRIVLRATARTSRALSDTVASAVDRTRGGLRVGPLVPKLIGLAFAAVGVAVGGLVAPKVGWQGWVLAASIVLMGILLPTSMFEKGWPVRVVRRARLELPAMIAHVSIQVSVASNVSVDDAVRKWAAANLNRRGFVLPRLIAQCPAGVSPVDFLIALEIPGLNPSLRLLTDVRNAPPDRQGAVLRNVMQQVLDDMETTLTSMAKKRAMATVVIGAALLTPTLILVVLAPPFLSLVQMFE